MLQICLQYKHSFHLTYYGSECSIQAPSSGCILLLLLHSSSAFSTSSRCAYHRSWHLFLKWKSSYTSFPVSEVDLCNFIGYLFSENYAPSSVSSHVSAIGYLHKLCSLPDPTENFLPKTNAESMPCPSATTTR